MQAVSEEYPVCELNVLLLPWPMGTEDIAIALLKLCHPTQHLTLKMNSGWMVTCGIVQ